MSIIFYEVSMDVKDHNKVKGIHLPVR
jgi:hypothetical protein